MPTALASNAASGSLHDPPTSLHPARWYTASGATSATKAGQAAGVEQVGAVVAVDADHRVAHRLEVADEVATHEAGGSGDERSHQIGECRAARRR